MSVYVLGSEEIKALVRQAASKQCECDGKPVHAPRCSRCNEVGDLLDVLWETSSIEEVLGGTSR